MPSHRLPLTYDECRARFQRACEVAAVDVVSHPIAARGPYGQELTIDVARLGAERPRRALAVLSGVHGVEGFLHSAAQADLVGRLDPTSLPHDVAVLLVHAVNPWGMAWWRRQNESNVDLNRNWRRDELPAFENDAYDVLHPLACPDTDTIPSFADLLPTVNELVAERGLEWVRDGITVGQYRHPDGLHYGGSRTEQSTAILRRIVEANLTGVERLLTVDLHTGHGPRAALTALCDQPPGSAQARFLATVFDRVEPTADNPDATTGRKRGQLANGFADVLPGAIAFATSLEVGTAGDLEQLEATYREQWVHRRGDRADPAHRAAIWAYRCCFTPDDAEWQEQSAAKVGSALDAAVAAVCGWA